MAVLKVAKLGNPVLRQIAKPVDLAQLREAGGELQGVIDDMIDTMHAQAGVGLAAPQAQRSVRIIVIECAGNKRYPEREDFPLRVLVNPVIVRHGAEAESGWEGCLSLPDLCGLVPRFKTVTVEAYERNGEKTVIEAEGFMAVVLQHEIDHLNGLLYIDRMTDLTQLTYREEFELYRNESPAVVD